MLFSWVLEITFEGCTETISMRLIRWEQVHHWTGGEGTLFSLHHTLGTLRTICGSDSKDTMPTWW